MAAAQLGAHGAASLILHRQAQASIWVDMVFFFSWLSAEDTSVGGWVRRDRDGGRPRVRIARWNPLEIPVNEYPSLHHRERGASTVYRDRRCLTFRLATESSTSAGEEASATNKVKKKEETSELDATSADPHAAMLQRSPS